MNHDARIRLARAGDVEAMLDIYSPVVRETAISFELTPPTRDEFAARLESALERTPWLVCEIGGEVAGYAYAGPLRSREAYQWSVEVTVYAHSEHRRRGVGKAVYTSLFECLKVQGYCNAYAAIALPNSASVALHEGLGFEYIGTYRSVGYKLGAWRDVGWWQREILPPTDSPRAPAALGAVVDSGRFQSALRAGLKELRRTPVKMVGR